MNIDNLTAHLSLGGSSFWTRVRMSLLVLAFAAITGLAVSKLGPAILVLELAGAGFAAGVAKFGSAFPIAAFALGASGTLPFIDPRRPLSGAATVQDAFVFALVATLALVWSGDRRRGVHLPRSAFDTAAMIWLAVWLAVALKTVIGGTPPLQALFIGRDFALIAVIAPLARRALSSPTRRRAVLLISMGWISVYSAAIAAVSIGASGLLNTAVISNHEYFQGGLLRVYPYGNDAVVAAFFIAVFGFLTVRRTTTSARSGWLLVAFCSLLALLLLQVRAYYLSVPLGLIVLVLSSEKRFQIVGRATAAIVALAVLGFVATLALPRDDVRSAQTAVVDRIASIGKDSESADATKSTVAYRAQVKSDMRSVLTQTNAWTTGLGFESASSNYVSALPSGSIRNSDVGFYNVLMTTGVVGVALYYGLMLFALVILAAGLRSAEASAWLAAAAAAYLVTALANAVTLGAFVSISGCVTTGVVLGLGFAAVDAGGAADGRRRGPSRPRRLSRHASWVSS